MHWPRSTILTVALLAAVTPRRVSTTVDPSNATELLVPDAFEDGAVHHYNVTHTYHRQAFAELGVEYVAPRCRQAGNATAIPYWLSEYELPSAIRVYDRWETWREVRNRTRIWSIVLGVVEKVGFEMDLRMKRVGRDRYYEMLDERLLRGRPGLLPLHIHFRAKPYPQSSFTETVTDARSVWEVYDDTVYGKYAGRQTDLLYRLRHNMRHSLGMGHTASKQSIMYPTNVAGLAEPSPLDTDALHVLLCDRRARLVDKTVLWWSSSSVVKLERPYRRDDQDFVFELPKRYFG